MNKLVRSSKLINKWDKLLKPQSVFFVSSYEQHDNSKQRRNEKEYQRGPENSKTKIALGALGVVGVSLASYFFYKYGDRNKIPVQLASYVSSTEATTLAKTSQLDASKYGAWRNDLPTYRLSEIQNHDKTSVGVWVVFREGVYDITNFIPEHPGSKRNIMMGAGTSVEPFWKTYGIHYSTEILDILEKYRIGNITKDESQLLIENVADPYQNEPTRSEVLKVANMKPYNAEPNPCRLLVENFYTPNEIFYVRNHLPVPKIDLEDYELEIELEGCLNTMKLTLDEIKKLPKHEVDATIMCAGNRRGDMVRAKEVKGLNWGVAAIGNAKWSGARLRDILKMAGAIDEDPRFKHVHFHGYDVDPVSNQYDISIPFHKAMSQYGDVILAYEMNGSPLPIDHGFPIRVVVPGTCGARNVKWLNTIVASKDESSGFYQQKDYKGFGPSDTWETANFEKTQSIQGLPVISAICLPEENETVCCDSDGYVTVKGYAYSGGGNKILRVDVTSDCGDTWTSAMLEQNDNEPPRHYAWTLWAAKVKINNPDNSKTELWVKAVDSNYNTQPENLLHIWNIRGVLNNAYHKVPINVQKPGVASDVAKRAGVAQDSETCECKEECK